MKKILLILLLLSVVYIPAYAKENNSYKAGEKIEITEESEQTSFFAGEEVFIKSKIDGINFTAGKKINISSNQDYIFAAGETVKINNATSKDAFVAGNNISINNSNIRDLYVAGKNINIVGNIERNIYATGEKITINAIVGNDVYVGANDVILEDETVIKGKLYYPDSMKESGKTNTSKRSEKEGNLVISKKAEVTTEKVTNPVKILSFKTPFKVRLYSVLFKYLSMLLIALVSLKFHKSLFKKIKSYDKNPIFILTTIIIGFLLLIVLPIIFILLLFTVFGIPLSILGIIVYIIMIYLSLIPVAFYLGNWLLKDIIKNDYLIMSLSLLVIYMLRLIPNLHFLVGFILLLFGFGLYFRSAKEYLEK